MVDMPCLAGRGEDSKSDSGEGHSEDGLQSRPGQASYGRTAADMSPVVSGADSSSTPALPQVRTAAKGITQEEVARIMYLASSYKETMSLGWTVGEERHTCLFHATESHVAVSGNHRLLRAKE